MSFLSAKIAGFLAWERDQDLTDGYVAGHGRVLDRWSQFLIKRNVELEHAALADVREFLESTSADRAAARTAIRSFYRFLIRSGESTTDPTENITLPHAHPEEPRVPTIEEVKILIRSVRGKSQDEIRDRALLELLYGTGITISEFINLDEEDVRLPDRLVYIRKQRSSRLLEERLIPFGRACSVTLRRYLSSDCRSGFGSALFRTQKGSRYSRQKINTIIRNRAARAGISELDASTLREAFAIHLLMRGARDVAVQQLLGLRNAMSMQRYIDVLEEAKLKKMLNDYALL